MTVPNFEAMSREFPDIVDPWKVADGKRVFGGSMPLAWMPRLEALLGEDQGSKTAWFEARFAYDRQGLVTIDLTVKADLQLVCQRSLEPYTEHVDRRSRLAVIENVNDEEELPEHYEPVLVEEKRLAFVELVEEELLLAVPQVPRNPELSFDDGANELSADVTVEESSAEEKEQTHRPFGGLAGLMKQSADD